jgi:hypothetical protein
LSEPKQLSYTADEIDAKLKQCIPLVNSNNQFPNITDETENWERAEGWKRITDLKYDPNSLYPQSGQNVAEAITRAIDVEFDAESTNAQSGMAVHGAIYDAINTALGDEGSITNKITAFIEDSLKNEGSITAKITELIEGAISEGIADNGVITQQILALVSDYDFDNKISVIDPDDIESWVNPKG